MGVLYRTMGVLAKEIEPFCLKRVLFHTREGYLNFNDRLWNLSEDVHSSLDLTVSDTQP